MDKREATLRAAVKRVHERLGLRYSADGPPMDVNRAVKMIELYDALMKIVGTEELARKWVQGRNLGLGNHTPQSLLDQPDGLDQVLGYVLAHLNRH